MNIEQLFERDIHRAINGVVKADQLDAESVWQELDEFVVTRELTRHITDLVAVLLSTMDAGAGAADRNGIWVSGFFGCGKSHLIKVLSYVLENHQHEHREERRHAIDFFAGKLSDPLLFADLRKVVERTTDTILFNIDSKADHGAGRDALLRVFLKVLNERQGYSSDHPHIAHMERYLDGKGKLAAFHEAYEKRTTERWIDERDAWELNRDALIGALGDTLGQSEASLEKWADGAESNFSLTVENFAKWVKQYLDEQEGERRIMFLVDEVGQFIGNDTHLMLNLQTITEQLGTICAGRAWVVVTSQEDLMAILGDLKQTKDHDFSKIQGRFKTRLSLSSQNVDEVIKTRLLKKKPAAAAPLAEAFAGKADILKNQLSFVRAGMPFKTYADADDFAACYPFAAYQFTLVQKVFESIRKAGATGLHLAQGERSTLDAFQSAARQVAGEGIGTLVPFHRFYPAVEGFLDTAVKRTIDRALESHTLETFDGTLLQVLFLIRYVDELPGSVDNLVTLCVAEIDCDRLALRKSIEASLARLEGETLIARNGDLYLFLTNEERDIGREIKRTDIGSGAVTRELGKLLFDEKELLDEARKHTYSLTQRAFAFTRLCDDQPVGHRIDGSLEVAFVTSLGDRYEEFAEDSRCVLHTSLEQNRLLIRLPHERALREELRTLLQTDAYVKTKRTGALPDTTKRILTDRSDDNRGRRKRVVEMLRTMLGDAAYFASGHRLTVSRGEPKLALGEAMEQLIKNAYPKMGFIRRLHPNPKQEIQTTLRANDLEQVALGLKTPEGNSEALDDLREYLRLCAFTSRQVVLSELIDKKYGDRPYGWPQLEVVLLVARLAVLKELDLIVDKAPLVLDVAYDHLTSASKQRKVILVRRESADAGLMKKAQDLGKELFAAQGGASEEALFTFLRGRLTVWTRDLAKCEPLARTGNYPGLTEIEAATSSLRKFVEESNSLRFLKRFVENRKELLDLAEDVDELQGFYSKQRHSWESLRAAVDRLSRNRLQLEAHPTAGPALAGMEAILANPRPYGVLHGGAELTRVASAANRELIEAARKPAIAGIQGLLDGVRTDLDKIGADTALRSAATGELQSLIGTARESESIAHIAQAREQSEGAYDRALTLIEKAQAQPPPPPKPPTPPTLPTSPTGTEEKPPPPPPPPPRIKKRRVVDAKALWSGGFIETSEDIDSFITKLRAELEDALAADERVQLK